jgi:hypothetical protein
MNDPHDETTLANGEPVIIPTPCHFALDMPPIRQAASDRDKLIDAARNVVKKFYDPSVINIDSLEVVIRELSAIVYGDDYTHGQSNSGPNAAPIQGQG